LVNPGVWRKYRFQAYGLAFPRQYMLDMGANHVWYLNSYVGFGFRWRAHDVNDLIDEAALDEDGNPDPNTFVASSIARLTPLIEVMGQWTTDYGTIRHKDFTFEREWRHVDDFSFHFNRIAAVIVPTGESGSFRREMEQAGLPKGWCGRVKITELDTDI
jgi:hypothetical protein